jgi:two-component system, LytTR family, sensor kinase
MKKSYITLLHLGFWLCYLFLIIVILGVLYGNDEQSVAEAKILNSGKILFFFALLPSAISFYSFYFFLFPKYLIRKKILLSIVYGLLISLGSAIIAYLLLTYAIENKCAEENDPVTTAIGTIIFCSLISIICGVIALVLRGFITWFEEIKLKDELKLKNRDMELALVKSQLDPHFLFNTINNIDVLILKNANEASNYLNKLSDIMRFMLFETKPENILLSKEIEYIEKYIELQKIRTANSNYVNFKIEGNADKKIIAPMVFIPFIENAFKHTTNKKTENAININIFIENKVIKLECKNKFDPQRKLQKEKGGLGNELIQKRLNLIYPDKHILEVSNLNGLYSVYLTLVNG